MKRYATTFRWGSDALRTTIAALLLPAVAAPAWADDGHKSQDKRQPEPVVIVAPNPLPVSGNVNATITGSVDAQGSARNAVSGFCYANIDPATGNTSCTLMTVPVGQVLVIESLSCFAHVPKGTPFESILLIADAPNPVYPAAGKTATINHFLIMTPTPNGDYGDISSYGLMSPLKLYSFGVPANSGSTTLLPVTINVQIGPFTLGTTLPQFGCSMAGVLESQ